jgi:hypothetical protein
VYNTLGICEERSERNDEIVEFTMHNYAAMQYSLGKLRYTYNMVKRIVSKKNKVLSVSSRKLICPMSVLANGV